MSRLIGVILITLALVLACGLAVSCAVPSAESTPSTTPAPTPPAAVQEPSEVPEATKIATVKDVWVSNISFKYDYVLCVELEPTTSALPDQKYLVELYENEKYRDTAAIGWNQPELNVFKKKLVKFPITREEFNAYFMENISHIFSVKVVGKSPKMSERQWEELTEGSR